MISLSIAAILMFIFILPIVIPFQKSITEMEQKILKLLLKQTVTQTDSILIQLRDFKDILASKDNQWREYDFLSRFRDVNLINQTEEVQLGQGVAGEEEEDKNSKIG